MVKIAYDAGHGLGTPGKPTPDGVKEWAFNDVVARAFANKLSKYQDVQLLRLDDPTGRTDTPLAARTNQANSWRADAGVSFHENAFKGQWGTHTGVEIYTHPQSNKVSKALALLAQPLVAKAMGLKDRGVKEADFHMLRESNMPFILVEGGYMDSTIDIKALRDKAKLIAQGEAVADAFIQFFNLKLKEEPKQVKEVVIVEYARVEKPSPALAKQYNEAVKIGITDGTYPKRPATREEVAVMIYRAIQLNK